MKVSVVELMRFGVPRPKEEVRQAEPMVGSLRIARNMTYTSPRILTLVVPASYTGTHVDLVTPLIDPWIGGFSDSGMTLKGLQRVTRAGVTGEYSQAWWIRLAGADVEFSPPHVHPQCARVVYGRD